MDLQFADTLLQPAQVEEFGSANDVRLGSLVRRDWREAEDPVLAIVGFPVDEGVRRNGGRPGAAAAPASIRAALYRLTPNALHTHRFEQVARRTIDLGDVRPSNSLSEAQVQLGEVVRQLISGGVTPIVLGGGHETAYGHFLGYSSGAREVAIVNVDAHLDVRPLIGQGGHSGSPFRQAMEHPSRACISYTVVGAQPSRTGREHYEYVSKRGGRILWADDVHDLPSADSLFVPAKPGAGIMLSIDLDAIDAAFAPGVSAPTTYGLHPNVVRRISFVAGASPSVTSVEFVEVNPAYDPDSRTARLAASIVWSFIDGFATRMQH